MAQAGFNAQESLRLLQPVLDLAAGSLGELTPQTAAGLAAQAMKAFGISVDDAAVAVDRMLQAVNVFALSAGELPLALGTASRGAQALNQSLSETLIALGLVKNIIPSVERASTATAVAMERMADPDVQARLRGIGVAVVDSEGGFRAFLDIVGDIDPGARPDDRRPPLRVPAPDLRPRGARRRQRHPDQVTNGIRTSTGETLRGAEAIAYLRRQFDEAGGTAARSAIRCLPPSPGRSSSCAGRWRRWPSWSVSPCPGAQARG
jgi:hypothetical protein